MRTAPLNYLITLALGGLAWFVAAIVVGNYLGENVSLLDASVEGFLGQYRTLLALAVALALGLCFYWYFYGSRPETAGRLPQAKRRWAALFLTALAAGLALVFALVLLFRAETFTLGQYALFFAAVSLNTYVLFWLSTLLMSPRTVINVPWGRR